MNSSTYIKVIVCVKTSGQVPDVFGHSCTMIGSIMFIHGGCARRWRYTNALYGLDLDTLIWRLYPCTGTHVEGRCYHTATAVGNHKIIVIGGHSSGYYSPYDKMLYCNDLRDGKWSQMITTMNLWAENCMLLHIAEKV